MAKKHKTYPLEQSPFYKLKSRAKLFKLLGISSNKVNNLLNKGDNYYEFDTTDKKTGKIRHIEAPKKRLEVLHHRIFILLARITAPTYLQSGVKGRSHISNAKMHIGSNELISLDIKKFYPSTKGWHVYEFFHKIMKCSPDVSAILKDISIYNDHIPTGSCLSQKLAFFAHYELFNEIESFSKEFSLTYSCFVDDINISGNVASKFHLNRVRVMLNRRGLSSHPKKEKLYERKHLKEVTGSMVTPFALKLPNKKHQDINMQLGQCVSMPDTKEKLYKLVSIKGKVIAGSQADPEMLKKVRAVTCEINRLTKVINL